MVGSREHATLAAPTTASRRRPLCGLLKALASLACASYASCPSRRDQPGAREHEGFFQDYGFRGGAGGGESVVGTLTPGARRGARRLEKLTPGGNPKIT